MSETIINDEEDTLVEIVEPLFEDFLKDFEIDPEGSLNDMLFEVFCAGFETALEVTHEEDYSEEA